MPSDHVRLSRIYSKREMLRDLQVPFDPLYSLNSFLSNPVLQAGGNKSARQRARPVQKLGNSVTIKSMRT